MNQIGERSQRFTRYFTLTHLYNAGLSDDELQTHRAGLSKLVNSLSWKLDVVQLTPVDPAKTIFRIDLRDYRWTPETWSRILSAYPYGVPSDAGNAKAVYDVTRCELPYVRGDWFVFAASRPPLYHDVLALPASDRELEKALQIDVAADIQNEHVAAPASTTAASPSTTASSSGTRKRPIGPRRGPQKPHRGLGSGRRLGFAAAAASLATNAAYSGVARPRCRTWSMAANSPRIRAGAWSQRPGKASLRKMPSSPGGNGS